MRFWSADDFFVEANKLKVSLNDPPFFMTFLIGKAPGDGRPMIDKQSADFGRKLQFETGRTLPAHRCVNVELYFDMVKGYKRSFWQHVLKYKKQPF